jgi:ceramide glucosyltransferase
MIFVFYALAALLVWLSAKSFVNGLDYLRYFKKELARSPAAFTPFVSVIVPCRGVDDGLAENLRTIVEQEYPEYEVVFVVDDINDPAVGAIEEASRNDAKNEKKTKLVIASRADGCGQKVENLREGVLHASDSSQIFVFADSDARPSKDWLRHLVALLEDKSVGAATGYRWFISRKPTLASEMRSVWNASVASALGPNTKSNFCWGGSTAIRRETFERLEVREKWRGTLSDDFALTQMLKDAGLPVVFVPQALTATVEDCTMREMLEFTTRQMKITRVYAGALWLMSLFGTGLFLVVMAAAFLIVILSRRNDLAVWISLAVMALVVFFSTGKAWLRLNAVKLVLTSYKTALDLQSWTQNTLWILSPALFFYNSIAALLSRRLTWRGITYELKSPRETVIIRVD